MSKMVGLSRAIKTEWLSKTVELVTQTSDEQVIKDSLNEYLSFEIQSPINIRKTREILMNIWLRPSNTSAEIWSEAIKAYQHDKGNRLALNWVMILLAYPVFLDVCNLIGKISSIQNTFTTAWLKEKILEHWGERTTLYHSSDKILQTIKFLGAIENVKVGTYRICPTRLTDTVTLKVMIMALLKLDKKAYYEVMALSSMPLFFPFHYDVSLEWLHNAEVFKISSFGGKIVISAKEDCL